MKHSRGFTLTEMLVVIAIIGIIAVVGIPAFQNYMHAFKLRTTANQVVNDLRFARQMATTENVPFKMTRTNDPGDPPGSYRLMKFATTQTTIPTPAQIKNGASWVDAFDPPRIHTISSYIRFVKDGADTNYFTDLDGDGNLDVVFMPNGTVFDDGGIIQFNETRDGPVEDNAPHLILESQRTNLVNRRYLIYCTYAGKVSARAYSP